MDFWQKTLGKHLGLLFPQAVCREGIFQTFTLLLHRVGNLLLPSSGLLLQPGRCQLLPQPMPQLCTRLCGELLCPSHPGSRSCMAGESWGSGSSCSGSAAGTAGLETDVAFKQRYCWLGLKPFSHFSEIRNQSQRMVPESDFFFFFLSYFQSRHSREASVLA